MSVPAQALDIVKVKIHSSALLSIFEQYQRRGENCPTRLVGVILGSVHPVDDAVVGKPQNGFVAEVRHGFPVPHSEFGDQVSINGEYYRSRMELHRKGYGRESHLLGWYSIHFGELGDIAASGIQVKNTEFIRDYFAREAATHGAPVSLNLTIAIKPDGHFLYQASCSEAISPRSSASASRPPPREIPSELVFGVPEVFACASVARRLTTMEAPSGNGSVSIPLSSLRGVRDEGAQSLDRDLETLRRYLEETQAGTQKEDPALTRLIQKIFSAMGLKEPESSAAEENARNSSRLDELLGALRIQLQRSEALFLNANV